jgi:maltooligosyltrehalose trehalohydrolase
VTFLQDHDQVGNRATGDRAAATLSDGLLRIGAALLLTGPFTPMLFMGEEWGARTPWAYFTDHVTDWLADAVRTGRRAEFAAHGWGPEDVPDPQAEETFAGSRLDWSEPSAEPHHGLLGWYQRLIALRHTMAELTDPDWSSVRCAYDEDARWFVLYRGGSTDTVAVVCNLGPDRQSIPVGWPGTGGPDHPSRGGSDQPSKSDSDQPSKSGSDQLGKGGPGQDGGRATDQPAGVVLDPLAVSRPGFDARPGSVEADGESVVIGRLRPRE